MEIEFIIKSPVLEGIKEDVLNAIRLIKDCIEDKNPILIRHHNDADGFTSGVALEKAILPLIYDTHQREREAWFAYSRKPNMTPYYSYEEANKDLSHFLSDKSKYEYKKPLVIILDNGSSDEDLLALKKLKIYGVKIIVIDHHPISSSVSEFIDVHVNPHKIGSTYDFSAGMLCAEIGKLLNPNIDDYEFIAAVSGISDKVQSKEKDEYVSLCLKKGYTLDFILAVAETLDYEAMSIGYADSRQLMDDFFGKDLHKQKHIILMLKEVIDRKKRESLMSAIKYSHISRTPKMNIVLIPMSQIGFRGDYPNFGKIVGHMHDYVVKQEEKPTVSIGLSESMLTFRGTQDSSLDVGELIKDMKIKFPHAQINGGGHKKAGSVRFIPAAYEEVKEFALAKIRE